MSIIICFLFVPRFYEKSQHLLNNSFIILSHSLMSLTKIAAQNNQLSSKNKRLGAQVSHLTPQGELQLFQESPNHSNHVRPTHGFPSEISNKSGSHAGALSTNDEKSLVQSRKHPQQKKKQANYQLEGLDDSAFPNHQEGDKYQNNLTLRQAEKSRPRKKSGCYEDKVDQFHLEEAKGIKPSLFYGEENSSPIHQPNEKFLIKPQRQQDEYNPNHDHSRNKKLKNADSRYNSKKKLQQQVARPEQQIVASGQKNKMRRLPSINQSAILSSFESSTIVLTKPKIEPTQDNLDPFSDEGVDRIFRNILQPITHKSVYRFVREQQFGVNFIHPDYKIVGDDGTTLISGKKQYFHLNSYYNLTAINFGQECVLGTLRGNFAGTLFNVYRSRERQQELIATIFYDSACLNDYRKMQVYIKTSLHNDPMFHAETLRKNLMELYNEGYDTHIQKHMTKDPVWNEASQSYIMSFGGKAKLPSIKNMILVPEKSSNTRSILFCKSARDIFNLEIYKSFSLLVTMGILLSSFDFKLLCQ